MIKNITLLVCLIVSSALFSQKMITRSGEIKFEASMPSFEEIAAKNNTASCLFDAATGEIAVLALVKGFVSMEYLHFNSTPGFYLFAFIFGIITTAVAGYIPARKAAKVDAIDIIRAK